ASNACAALVLSSTTLSIAIGSGKRPRSVGELQQTIHMESKILEEKAQLQETRQILDTTKDIRNQDHLLRETTARLIEKDLLDESYVKNSGQKRPYFKVVNNVSLDKRISLWSDKLGEDFIPVNLTHFVPGGTIILDGTAWDVPAGTVWDIKNLVGRCPTTSLPG
ncbi:17031_t:CDS:2, partial [Funneliformis caledonium]